MLTTALDTYYNDNRRSGVSNYQPHVCLLNRSFRRRSKKTSKLRLTGLCAENSPLTGEFPPQMSSNAEIVSIWWRHHILRLPWKILKNCISIEGISSVLDRCLINSSVWTQKVCWREMIMKFAECFQIFAYVTIKILEYRLTSLIFN